jgi:hypothetical protein
MFDHSSHDSNEILREGYIRPPRWSEYPIGTNETGSELWRDQLMNRLTGISEVDMIAQLADLKEVDYKNTLVLTALVELLVDKGILTRAEVIQKARQLDTDLSLELDRSLYAN